MRGLLTLLGTVAAVYLVWLALLFVQQRSMMFPGAGMGWLPGEAPLPPGGERVRIAASFGDVAAVYLPGRGDAERVPAALYFHGNAETVAQNVGLLARVAELGIAVLLVEYPGYAGADGAPSRASLNEAARLGYDWLAARGDIDAARIVAIGRSVGAGPAVELTTTRDVHALVLLSAFTSVAEFARRFGAPGFLARDAFDNVSLLSRYERPVLLFHGRDDGIIPFRHSERLAQASADAALVAVDCGHNDCPYFDDAFIARLEDFLADAGVLHDPRASRGGP